MAVVFEEVTENEQVTIDFDLGGFDDRDYFFGLGLDLQVREHLLSDLTRFLAHNSEHENYQTPHVLASTYKKFFEKEPVIQSLFDHKNAWHEAHWLDFLGELYRYFADASHVLYPFSLVPENEGETVTRFLGAEDSEEDLPPIERIPESMTFWQYFQNEETGFVNLVSMLRHFVHDRDVAVYNIRKYGYADREEDILVRMGFKAPAPKKPPSKRAVELAEFFQRMFPANIDAFIRIRNKSKDKSWAYPLKTLKDPRKMNNMIYKHDVFKGWEDVMASLNVFNTVYGSSTNNVLVIQHLAIDIDFYEVKEYKNATPEAIMKLLEAKYGVSIPTPNAIEYGHGCRAIYSLAVVGGTANSRAYAQRVTHEIGRRYVDFGGKGQPIATYMRVPGSKNTRNEKKIQYKTYREEPYILKELGELVLPPRPEKKLQSDPGKAAEKPKKISNIKNREGVILTQDPASNVVRIYHTQSEKLKRYNTARIRDLEKIQGLPRIRNYKGHREVWLYLYFNQWRLYGTSAEEAYEKTLKRNRCFQYPIKESKVKNDLVNLIKGKKGIYTPKSETILKKLDVTVEEERELGLEVLRSGDIKRDDARERSKAWYAENKNKVKERYRAKAGKMKQEKVAEELVQIRELLEQGYTRGRIAEALKISESTIKRRIRELKEQGVDEGGSKVFYHIWGEVSHDAEADEAVWHHGSALDIYRT